MTPHTTPLRNGSMSELRDKMPDRKFPLQLPEEKGLDRCIRTICAAVATLHDCGESNVDIQRAMTAINLFGPDNVIKRMEAAEAAE